jgi:hypothetical protein
VLFKEGNPSQKLKAALSSKEGFKALYLVSFCRIFPKAFQ